LGKWKYFFLDRQNVECPPNSAIDGFHLRRPQSNLLNYVYSCNENNPSIGGKEAIKTTQKDETDINKKESANFLDRHHVDCKNGFALRQFKLMRDGDKIFYSYTCVKAKCSARQTTHTQWNDGGKNEVIYLDRKLVVMIKGRVITGFKLETKYTPNTQYRFAIDYCILQENNLSSSAIARTAINPTLSINPNLLVDSNLTENPNILVNPNLPSKNPIKNRPFNNDNLGFMGISSNGKSIKK
jgi:hypothetical protein